MAQARKKTKAATKKAAKSGAKKAPRTRRAKMALEAIHDPPSALALDERDPALMEIADAVHAEGGAVIGGWRDPLRSHPLLLATLPLDAVAPTPFQRDASPAHVRKLVRAIGKTGRFLDPVIVARMDGRWLTPNGNHRLEAMRELGASSITALVVPERAVAYQILALNTEKAHNLRERAIEVRRMVLDMAGWAPGGEQDYELELEEPALVTLGFAYEGRPRFAGGAYRPALHKADAWIAGPLDAAIEERRRRAGLLLALDDAVNEAVDALKARGLKSPYLKAFVVARANPIRARDAEAPPLDELLEVMTRRAHALDATRISSADLARSGGAPEHDD